MASSSSNPDANQMLGLNLSLIRKTSDTPPRVSVLDLIGVVSKVTNPRDTWSDFKCVHKHVVDQYCTTFKFSGRGQQNTPVVCIDNIMHIVEPLLAGARISMGRKLKILNRPDLPLRRYTEVEIHACIRKALNLYESFLQFRVGSYRVDLYFPKECVAVECDEHCHQGYDQAKERVRHQNITKLLHCKWVRYDPYKPHFDIFELIGKVLEKLQAFHSVDESTTHSHKSLNEVGDFDASITEDFVACRGGASRLD